jgi:hypothetical protein
MSSACALSFRPAQSPSSGCTCEREEECVALRINLCAAAYGTGRAAHGAVFRERLRVHLRGDVVCFPRGKDGAHQIINRTDSPIRVLMLSSMIRGEIIEYLDTGKVLAKGAEDQDIMFARPGPPSCTGKARSSSGRGSR